MQGGKGLNPQAEQRPTVGKEKNIILLLKWKGGNILEYSIGFLASSLQMDEGL